MALSKNDQDTIRGYLLGRLTDEERQNIEERLMTDDDFFEELEISKEEVIEDYCAGELTSKEQEWLEQHLLASPEGKFRRRFGLALDGVALAVPKAATVPGVPKGPSLIDRFRAFWKSQSWAPIAVASAVVVLVVGAVALKSGFFSSQPKTSLALTLISSAPTRGGESPRAQEISMPSNVDELAITLVLPTPTPPGASYRVELDDSNKVKPVDIAQHDSKSVLVKIPSDQLRRGQYVLKLFTREADGVEQSIPVRYFFNIA
jgi:hypothetical protein